MVKILLGIFFASLLTFNEVSSNSYDDLTKLGLISPGVVPALHLGCGDVHFNGFINIDFPKENRSLHTGYAADYFCDICKLCFPKNSIYTIESHHLFEHFPRPIALALICAWHIWLRAEGNLIIETPDFNNGIQRYLKSDSFKEKQIVIRHLYGSHEENWAVHWDGWYEEKYKHILHAFGFEIQKIRSFSWLCLDNIEVKATKKVEYNISELREIAKGLLKLSCVDSGPSETHMWEGWCNDFNRALDIMIEQK